MEKTITISARIYKSQLERIEELARKRGTDKSDALRKLIEEGLKAERLQEALKLVRESKITVWRAAEIAGVSYREMLRILKAENVPFPLSTEELEKELGELLEGD